MDENLTSPDAVDIANAEEIKRLQRKVEILTKACEFYSGKSIVEIEAYCLVSNELVDTGERADKALKECRELG